MPITLLLDLRSIVCRIPLLALRLVCSTEHAIIHFRSQFTTEKEIAGIFLTIQEFKFFFSLSRFNKIYRLLVVRYKNYYNNWREKKPKCQFSTSRANLSFHCFSNLKFCCIICILHFYFHFAEHAPSMEPTCQTMFDYIYIYWINERWTGTKQ